MNLLKLTLATLIFVMSFAMQSNEAEAQFNCDYGYNSFSFVTQYPNTDCIYNIEFCYRCDYVGPSQGSSIKDVYYEPINFQDANCPVDNVIDWVMSEIAKKFYDLCNIPPCDEGIITFTTELPLCVQRRNYAWIDDGVPKHFSFIQTCFQYDYVCIEPRTVCYDVSSGEYIETPLTRQPSGTPCSFQMPILPPPGMTWYDNWDSDCWVGRTCY